MRPARKRSTIIVGLIGVGRNTGPEFAISAGLTMPNGCDENDPQQSDAFRRVASTAGIRHVGR